VSIFASCVEDARSVFAAVDLFDSADPFSRRAPAMHKGLEGDVRMTAVPSGSGAFRFGVPHREQRRFFGDSAAEGLYEAAVDRLIGIGGEIVPIDFGVFGEVSELLYGGPWVAERDAAVGDFMRREPGAVWPEVRSIISGAGRFSATDVFNATYRLQELRRKAEATFERVDFLALPTTGTIYRVEEVLADPIVLNTNLGYYTNFVNLLDLSALALPAGFRSNGTPFGISLVGSAWEEEALFPIACAYESSYGKG
jgi:allophanate hydrolase